MHYQVPHNRVALGRRQVDRAAGSRTQDVSQSRYGAKWRDRSLLGDPQSGRAVQSASAAFGAWRTRPQSPCPRAQSFLDLLNQRRDELAAIITSEHGKVLSDAQGEVMRGIRRGGVCLRNSRAAETAFTRSVSTGIDNWTLRQPLGCRCGKSRHQLPLHGAVLDVPRGPGSRQHSSSSRANAIHRRRIFMAELLKAAGA